jgi:hypothetical protein
MLDGGYVEQGGANFAPPIVFFRQESKMGIDFHTNRPQRAARPEAMCGQFRKNPVFLSLQYSVAIFK